MYVDLPESQLRDFTGNVEEPEDFDAFWTSTLEESRAFDSDVTLQPVTEHALTTIDIWDVSFRGFGGQRIAAWLRVPAHRDGPLPLVVEYVGYGGGRGYHFDNLLWASAGYAHLHVDTRGQGSTWSTGVTPDDAGSSPQHPGFMTRGIEAAEHYYYRRVFTDAVRAIDAARTLDVVDPGRIAVMGGSQGGGISLAVSALVPGLNAVAVTVPFLCDIARASVITDKSPYREIANYLAVHREETARAHRTLSYFDGVNFSQRASVPAIFSTALMDEVSPPSTVFAAYNAYAGPKDIAVWPYNAHEGGQWLDQGRALSHFAKNL